MICLFGSTTNCDLRVAVSSSHRRNALSLFGSLQVSVASITTRLATDSGSRSCFCRATECQLELAHSSTLRTIRQTVASCTSHDRPTEYVRYSRSFSKLISTWSSTQFTGLPVSSFLFDLLSDDAHHAGKRFFVDTTQSFEVFRFEVFVLQVGHVLAGLTYYLYLLPLMRSLLR